MTLSSCIISSLAPRAPTDSRAMTVPLLLSCSAAHPPTDHVLPHTYNLAIVTLRHLLVLPLLVLHQTIFRRLIPSAPIGVGEIDHSAAYVPDFG